MNSVEMIRVLLLAASLSACSGDDDAPPPPSWEVEMEQLAAGLLSVWGTSESDIWAVGGDPSGSGPTVLRFNGTSWSTLQTGQTGDLWWVFGFPGGAVYLGGGGGQILRYQNGAFTKMTTPGTGTVFGIWGSSPTDVWAVGSAGGGTDGFAWKLDGDQWVESPCSGEAGFSDEGLWKVWGHAANDVWLVGTFARTIHWNGSTCTVVPPIEDESVFTVHCNSSLCAAVGGFGTGIILENQKGSMTWTNVTPPGAAVVNGVCLTETGGYAVGADGSVFTRDATGWKTEETDLDVFETLHACWVAPNGEVWAVGGDVLAFPLIRGVMVHRHTGGTEE